MRGTAAIAAAILLLAAGWGSAMAHGKGKGPHGNHGAAVSAVAHSKCVASNPHHPKVKNHGQCVRKAARHNHGQSQAHKHGKDKGEGAGHGKGSSAKPDETETAGD
jgi:hypothetical protein